MMTRMTNRKMRQYFLLFFLATLFHFPITGQEVNLGIPPLINFPKKQYGAGTQNWSAVQDERGIIYWANNEGLLSYDGTSWSCLPIPNNTIIRSLAIAGDNRIYIGAQSEIGYFKPAENGTLLFTSLLSLLPETERSFEDVWEIVVAKSRIYFRTNHHVFIYDPDRDRIDHIRKEAVILGMFTYQDEVYVQTSYSTIEKLTSTSGNTTISITGLHSEITGFIPIANDTLLLTSLKDGLFYLHGEQSGAWMTRIDAQLREKRIYSATSLLNGHLALGTSLDGLIILDHHRRVISHFNKKTGLQNNNILHTFCDKTGNIWLGLDNGIDFIHLQSPFRFVYPDGEMQATGYSAAVHHGQLYLGVSNGAYVAPWQSYYNPESGPLFHRVEGTEGQVWNINEVNNDLFMGHHEGAFQITGQQANAIRSASGSWTYVPFNDEYIIGGAYDGLAVFHKTSLGWSFIHMIEGLHESCRIMIRTNSGDIWISHPYRGLYKVRWNPAMGSRADIQFYDHRHGLPSDLNNYVFGLSGDAFFGTEKGVYQFDASSDKFIPSVEFNQWLGDANRVKFLKEDLHGHIWFLTDTEAGVLLVDDSGLRKNVVKKIYPELLGKFVGGFEFMYPVDKQNYFIASEQGFIHYIFDPNRSQDTSFHIILNRVSAKGETDTLLFGGFITKAQKDKIEIPILHAGLNNLSFSYSATAFSQLALVEYRTWLEGLEQNWSGWSTETKKNFTNLGPDKYTFHVEARLKHSNVVKSTTYSFRIRPPWYKSNIAFGIYGLSLMGLLSGYMMRQRQRFESEKARMTETHQLKEAEHRLMVEQSKAALSEMQHEKLQAEIGYKNQELALTTMHLVQKAEILLTVQDTLRQISEKNPSPEVRKEIQQLLNMLNFDVNLDEDWEHFAFHFDQVHVNFLKHLRERFPQLSANDLKLCAYLRMNLSTKEIAPLMNISIRGVEGSRYRLRKKLDLPNDANLNDYMLNMPAGHSPSGSVTH